MEQKVLSAYVSMITEAPEIRIPRASVVPRKCALLLLSIKCDDGGTTEAQIVLECDLGPIDLSLLGLSAKLPVEL